MAELHHLDHLLGNGPRVLLLDQLREDAFKIGQAHEAGELRGTGVSENFSLGDDDDAIADLLDDFEDMRDVKDGLAFRGEQFEEVFEETRGDDVEAGERLVKDQQPGIVEEGRGDEHALTHSFGIGGDGGVLPGLEVEQLEQTRGFGFEKGFRDAAETADELQIFKAGEVAVKMGLFRDVADGGAEGHHVFANVAAFKQHTAFVGTQHAGDDLDGGGFSRAVGTEEADDFSGGDAKADVLYGGYRTEAAVEVLEL
jgi:hypothetical protein